MSYFCASLKLKWESRKSCVLKLIYSCRHFLLNSVRWSYFTVNEGARQYRQLLYRECFTERPHPSWQIIENIMKRFLKTGNVTKWLRPGRPRSVRQLVQPEGLLAYALVHPQSSTREIRKNCGLTKGQVWIILYKLSANPYRPSNVQALIA